MKYAFNRGRNSHKKMIVKVSTKRGFNLEDNIQDAVTLQNGTTLEFGRTNSGRGQLTLRKQSQSTDNRVSVRGKDEGQVCKPTRKIKKAYKGSSTSAGVMALYQSRLKD